MFRIMKQMFLGLLASIVNTNNHTKCISLNNLMAANITQIENGITKNGDVSVNIQKNIKCEKKIIFGILLHVVVKMVNT